MADHGAPDALSITELYGRVDRAVRTAFPDEVWITGEVRSIKVLPKGHCFIDLVDPAHAQDQRGPHARSVKCWAGTLAHGPGHARPAGRSPSMPAWWSGSEGEVELYKARGTVDFILSELDTEALLGKVAAERARLIQALVDEDLFDRQRRLPSPGSPLRVGLVASPGTEGYNDFLGGLEGSGMAFAVPWRPPPSRARTRRDRVAAAIADLQRRRVDVIVVVRGGGSKADLAAFDQEPVARAIATSDIPVWTGIGHTGDQSVADEVANRSFITPTECGQELARLATRLLAGRDGSRARCSAGWPGTGWSQSEQVLAAPTTGHGHRRPDRSSTATPTGSAHRARTCAAVGHGARSTPTAAASGRRRPVAWPGRRPIARCRGGRRWPGAPGAWPACPTAARGGGAPDRPSGGGCSVPTTTSASSNGATRSPATRRGRCSGRSPDFAPGSPAGHPAGRRRPSTRRSPTTTPTRRHDTDRRRRERSDGHDTQEGGPTPTERRLGGRPSSATRTPEPSWTPSSASSRPGVVDVDRLVEQLERATDIVDELDRRLRRTRMRVEELVPRLEAIGQGEAPRTTTVTEDELDGSSEADGPLLTASVS